MADLDVFQFSDYRDFLKKRVEKAKGQKGLMTKMAVACKCERSHISRVLHEHLHLTMDQAYGMCEFWSLNDSEALYFLRLVEIARAAHPHYRKKLERELSRLRQAHENISKRLAQPSLEIKDVQVSYYAAWYWSAIHIIVSIPHFQTVAKISRRLQLPESLVVHTLEELKKFGLVTSAKDKWIFSSTTLHLPKDSPLSALHLDQWRRQAVQAAQTPGADGVHYTTVQSLSRADFDRLKLIFLQSIDQFQQIALPSNEEELAGFNLDFFRVGGASGEDCSLAQISF